MKRWVLYLGVTVLLVFAIPRIGSFSFGKKIFLFLLGHHAPGVLSVKKVRLSWLGPQILERVSLHTDEYSLRCGVVTIECPLWRLQHWEEAFSIENSKLTLPHYQEIELVDGKALVEGKVIKVMAHTAKQGFVIIDGTYPSAGAPPFWQIQLHNIPTDLVDQILHCDGWLQKTLGASLTLKGLYTEKEATQTLSIYLRSPHIQSSFDALIKNHELRLLEPWVSTITLSDSLRSALRAKLGSEWIGDLQPKQPILLEISHQDFLCPLPFQWSTVQVGHGILDLGKLLVQSNASTRFLMTLFKGQAMTNPTLFWMTPIPFQLRKEILSVGRTDMLLSPSIHLCTWGHIDLKTERLKLSLGIPITTLQNVIHKAELSNDYMFTIPITGSILYPKFHTSHFLWKMGVLAAGKELSSTGAKLFQQLSESSDTTIPPPQGPFPWQQSAPEKMPR